MGKAEADWKRQRWHVLDWLTAGVALLLVAVYGFLWVVDGQGEYLGIAVVIAAWVAVFFTRYWQPILYLIIAVVVASVTAFWLVRGVWTRPVFQAAIALDVVFLALIVYLLASEERPG